MIWPCSPPWNDGDSDALSLAAVAGLASTALSQVSRVIGLGSSCSQPLFAKRPSRIDGSLRKETSRPVDAVADCGLRIADSIADWIADWATVTVFGANAVLGTTPSCSQRRQV